MDLGQLEKGDLRIRTHTKKNTQTKQISKKYIYERLKYYIKMLPVDTLCRYLK